ncbi:MAG: O-antigen ligase family protein [Gemmatimonadota bacterium]
MTAPAFGAFNSTVQPLRGRRGPAAGGAPAPKARRFDYLVAMLIPIYVWRIQDAVPLLGKLQLPIIVSLASIAMFLYEGHATREKWRFKLPSIKGALFVLGWMIVSIPTSVYPGNSFRFVFNDFIKTFLVMLMITASIRHISDVERIAMVNLASAAIYCLKIVTTFQVNADGRLGAVLYYDANDLAMMVVLTIPIAVYFLRSGVKPMQRVASLGCFAIFALVVARTGSRGGFLGLIAVVGVLLVGFRAIPVRVRFGSVAAIGSLLVIFAGPTYWEMMGTILNPKEDYNANVESGRVMVWQRGMGYLAGHPMTGVGVDGFPIAEGTISEMAERQSRGQGVKWSAAHNSFVQVAAELGIPGIIGFLIFLYHLFKTCWVVARSKRPDDAVTLRERAFAEAMFATMVGYVVAGFFLSQAYAAYLYANCGIISGLAAIAFKSAQPALRAAAAQRGRAPLSYRRAQ